MADVIRDTFKRGKYQDVILPLTVTAPPRLRAGTHQEVAAGGAWNRFKGKLDNLDRQLRRASGVRLSTTRCATDIEKLLAVCPPTSRRT